MSHIVGTVQTVSPAQIIGPDSGAAATQPNIWSLAFSHTPAPTGTKFLILHFQNVVLPANNRLEVDLGYDTDIFTSADGASFWTRPINIYALANALVPIRYITNGAANGSVQLDQYGRGEQHAGETGHPSISNCDPFMKDAVYTEPKYDPFWYCTEPPNWENVGCVTDPNDVRARVARSVGIIITVEASDFTGQMQVSTCSVTLVDTDKVLTAGHCHTPTEVLSGSVSFDYQTDCTGNRPAGYKPNFYKVKKDISQVANPGALDYSLLQLAKPPVGVPPIEMRADLPAANESVFSVAHPNGAIKKLSPPHPNFGSVLGSTATSITVSQTIAVSGGSSGSGLFDLSGRIMGVLSDGNPCQGSPLDYCPTVAIRQNLVPTPPPPVTRDVMLVFDRSGSMLSDDGTGRKKIDVAKDAVSLFVQLIQSGTGNRVGLVSFSTQASSPVDEPIKPVVNALKNTLIGPAPYAAGIVGGIAPGGNTTIGGGLKAALTQFPGAGVNPRSILLLTDGLENTPPMIADENAALGGISVNAIGFGTAANLNGTLLTALANAHGGQYTQANDGIALEKFFSSAFGNIFEAGILKDPQFSLPANQSAGTPLPFPVAGEEAITVVVGWDRPDASLLIQVTTPGGAVLSASTAGTTTATGRTWSFLKVPLPFGGERNGIWNAQAVRPGGGGEFPPPSPALRYFLNVIPSGGPRLTRMPDSRLYYTGDTINPRVALRYTDGSWPENGTTQLTLTRPSASIGNILAAAGLKPATTSNGDTIPPIQATLQAVEAQTGTPAVLYADSTFTMGDDSVNTGGLFESCAIFGTPLTDQLTVEGNYTFRVSASYLSAFTGSRELMWSLYVAVGIDPGKTVVTSQPIGTCPDGSQRMRLTFAPQDRYGNLLGPGRADVFNIESQPGTAPTSPVQDLGNGSYQIDVCWDPNSSTQPTIGITQPQRPTVVVGGASGPNSGGGGIGGKGRYIYGVKFVCGEQKECGCGCGPVRPGIYATEINIHNYQDREVKILLRAIPLVLAGAARGRAPKVAKPVGEEILMLPAHGATMEDCCHILERLLEGKPEASLPLSIGVLEIISTAPLNVLAVYTAGGEKSEVRAMEVQAIEGHPMEMDAASAKMKKCQCQH